MKPALPLLFHVEAAWREAGCSLWGEGLTSFHSSFWFFSPQVDGEAKLTYCCRCCRPSPQRPGAVVLGLPSWPVPSVLQFFTPRSNTHRHLWGFVLQRRQGTSFGLPRLDSTWLGLPCLVLVVRMLLGISTSIE